MFSQRLALGAGGDTAAKKFEFWQAVKAYTSGDMSQTNTIKSLVNNLNTDYRLRAQLDKTLADVIKNTKEPEKDEIAQKSLDELRELKAANQKLIAINTAIMENTQK